MKIIVLPRIAIQGVYTSLLEHSTRPQFGIISISDPKETRLEFEVKENCIGVLYLEFHDLDQSMCKKVWEECKDKYILFNSEMAKQVLEFIRNNNTLDILLCQCHAGISRSAGIAAAISKILYNDDSEFFRDFIPNRLVYRTILEESIK